MNTTRARSIRASLTRSLFLRMAAVIGLLSVLALAALHLLLTQQQDRQLDRRVAKITDIAVKAERDGVALAERLAEYAPRRPGTRLVVVDASGTTLYRDADVAAHTLTQHVRTAVFTPQGMTARDRWPLRFEITIDVSDDVELVAAMAAMLSVVTLVAALAARWAGADAVRQGFEPIDRLEQALARIDPSNLAYRVHLTPGACELEPWIDRFNALLERLESAYRQLESFNADVAHELRTPLNNLIGHTEVALSRPRSAEQLQETLSSNLEELHRLGHLVHDMLFLSRADRGAQARRDGTTSLARIAHEVADFHEAAAEERGLRVEVLGDALVAVDAGLMRRAVSNLLSNAVRHAAPHSALQIAIEASNAPSEHEVSVTVRNQGPDIAQSTCRACSSASSAPTPLAARRTPTMVWACPSWPPSHACTADRLLRIQAMARRPSG
jgi:two-component system heavy metal sensor histidine kinase CusS